MVLPRVLGRGMETKGAGFAKQMEAHRRTNGKLLLLEMLGPRCYRTCKTLFLLNNDDAS